MTGQSRQRLLITGPGGRVGTRIVPLLRSHFTLRLFDVQRLKAEGDDEVIQGDIRDFDALKKACTGVDAMLHLAAFPDEADFNSLLLPMNLLGGYNAFEAARQAGVPKVLFASTGQTILNYGRSNRVTTDMPVRPATVYGCTKVFGEALGRYYSDKHGLNVIIIRVCWFQGYDSAPLRSGESEMAHEWCSPRDLTQLIVKCVASDLKFAIFFGISNNTGRKWDITNAQELVGYSPEDDSAKFIASAKSE